MASQLVLDRVETPCVSTGHLPRPDIVQSLVDEAHRRFEANADGKNSDIYPALAHDQSPARSAARCLDTSVTVRRP